jgi:polyhydroxyalkanoate synthesis regulator phasin
MPQPKQPAARKPATKRTTTARKKPAAGRRPPAPKRAAEKSLIAALEELRDEIARSFSLTAERVQETFDDSVRRGRLTRTDAEKLVDSLLAVVRSQRKELLDDLEVVLERGASSLTGAASDARRRALDTVEATARSARRTPVADRALREDDRARRATGLAGFPITGYDDLTVSQVVSRLGDLTEPDLRKVRDYERAHANRKSVLAALEKRLG